VKLPPRKEKADVGERLLDNVSLFVQLCFFSSSTTLLILKTPISSLLSYKKPHTMVAHKTVVLLDCWSSSFSYFFQHHGQWNFLDQFLSDLINMCTYWISNAHWSQALQIYPLSNLEWKYSNYRFQYDNFMWRNLGCFCHHDRCIGGQRNSITCVGTGVSLNPLQIPWVHPTKEKKEKKRKEKYTLLPFSSIWVNIMFKLGTFGLESKSRLMFISSNFQYHFLKPSNSSLLLGLLHLKG
jgi:hypothetical protein